MVDGESESKELRAKAVVVQDDRIRHTAIAGVSACT